MPPKDSRIQALRSSQNRFAELVGPLDDAALQTTSYAPDWTVAAVASHLGSQAEVFSLFLDAGLTGGDPPGIEAFRPIWDRWNALPPAEQRDGSVAGNEALVRRVEGLTDAEWAAFDVEMFGSKPCIGEFAGIRLSEHAVHTWDIAVALDPRATLAPDATVLLVDGLPVLAARAGRAPDGLHPTVVLTRAPDRVFSLTATEGKVALEPTDDPGAEPLTLPAEALIRLVHGRLDAEHTPADVDADAVAALRPAFPGF